uniref:RICTOR_N domain-containing protein n=1 Tax=Wuchereria bancrofti TaxID=6293 RepID=A0A1I8EYL4_WUCBA
MRKLSEQVTTNAEISHSLERAFNARGQNLENTEKIVDYLNNLCTMLANIAKYVLWEASSVRAITYRILRKASKLPNDLSVLLNMHMDCFAIRSLELDTNNSEERIEALKLCTVMLGYMSEETKSSDNGIKGNFSSAIFPQNVCRALISIANCFSSIGQDSAKIEKKKDELAFSCFAVILEQAVVAPDLILNSVDTGWIVELCTNAVFSDRLSTFVCRILCMWLDSPRLRMQAKLRFVLNRIFASVVEVELFERKEPIQLEQHWLSSDSFQLENFSQIFLNLLRTWAGLFACSALGDQKTSVIPALCFLDYIGLNRPARANSCKIHNLINFHIPKRDSQIGLIQRISTQHTNVNDLLVSFRSVVVYLLINANLVQALSRIILQDPDDPVALRATLLMYDLLLASSTCLPMEWRHRVLSLSTLVHSAYEIISESHISKKCSLDDNDYETDKFIFTRADRRNVIILLNRLEILNSIALAQKTQPLPITNLQLFVQSSPTATKLRKAKLSEVNFDYRDGDANYVETVLEKLLFKIAESDRKPCWPVVDRLFHLLQTYYCCKDIPIKYSRKCYSIFTMVFNFITPAKGSLINFDGDRFVIICCCRAVHVSLLFATREAQYKELLIDFINDFMSNISAATLKKLKTFKDALFSGPLSPKNLVNTGAMYYFSFIGAISSNEEGRQMLEATPLLQIH